MPTPTTECRLDPLVIGSGDTILVVGGGAGAFSFASTYRDAGGDRPIMMLSADDRLPYFRPALSKELLLGEQAVADVQLADPGWFAERDVEVGSTAEWTAIDVGGRSATTAPGPARWADCVLATGSSAGTLPIPGADDERVLSVRAASDAEQLLARVGRRWIGRRRRVRLRRLRGRRRARPTRDGRDGDQ